jgi:hypothetical protein
MRAVYFHLFWFLSDVDSLIEFSRLVISYWFLSSWSKVCFVLGWNMQSVFSFLSQAKTSLFLPPAVYNPCFSFGGQELSLVQISTLIFARPSLRFLFRFLLPWCSQQLALAPPNRSAPLLFTLPDRVRPQLDLHWDLRFLPSVAGGWRFPFGFVARALFSHPALGFLLASAPTQHLSVPRFPCLLSPLGVWVCIWFLALTTVRRLVLPTSVFQSAARSVLLESGLLPLHSHGIKSWQEQCSRVGSGGLCRWGLWFWLGFSVFCEEFWLTPIHHFSCRLLRSFNRE